MQPPEENTRSVWNRLRDPFEAKDISLKVQMVSKKNPNKGMVVPYIKAPIIMERLDRVVGPSEWWDD